MTMNNNVVNVDNNAAPKRATFNSGLPDLNQRKKYPTPLRILLSSRVRLTESQREELKIKWRKMRDESAPKHTSLPGSTVRTVSPASQAVEKLKTSQLIISDLINSRDSISLATVFEIQRLFDIEIVSKQEWLEAAEGYWSYVSGNGDD